MSDTEAGRRIARISKRRGFFEKARQVQATLTRIFVALESESHGFSESETVFLPQKQVIYKKKRSSPKLRRNFRPESEIQTLFPAESWLLLHNFGTQILLGGGGVVFIFSAIIGLKSIKNMPFCILYRPMGGSSPPPPLATLLEAGREVQEPWGCFH